MDRSRKSPVDGIIAKNGPTAYHICYSSSQFDEDLEKLMQNGYRVVLPPTAAAAFGNRKVVFLMHLSIGIVEIAEQD